MSDNWIALVPEDSRFVPDVATQGRARDRFAEVAPEADAIEIKVSEKIEFFGCGANLERICCPSCIAEISIEWWQDRMDEDHGDGFKLATYATPCCGAKCTLHDLVYEWSQGFGRFALIAMNPNIGMLDDKYKLDFEIILGTKLRVIIPAFITIAHNQRLNLIEADQSMPFWQIPRPLCRAAIIVNYYRTAT